ncbi:MAG: glycosyltransferase family 4 protein, partial [Pseudomonadota bacterium]
MMIAPLRFLHVFSTFGTGGPQVRFAQIANDLARHGASPIEHVICAMDGRHDALSKLDPDVRYRIVEAPRSGRSVVRTINAFRQAFRHHAPDLLLTYNWGAIECSMANILHRLPEIHFEDGFGPDEAAGQLRRRILTRRLVLRRQALTVMPSQVLLDHARTLWRLPSSRLTYIPNGIDCSRFDVGRRADADGGDGNTRVVIGTVAGLRKEKNLARLLQAFAKLPEPHEASLVIVGSGPEEETLKAMALSLGVADRVQFKGFCARPET